MACALLAGGEGIWQRQRKVYWWMGSFRASELAVLLTTVALAGVAPLWPRRWWHWAGGALVVIALAWHLVDLKLYWQILPAYAGGLLLLLVLAAPAAPRRAWQWSALAGALVVASAASLAVFPLFNLPAPTGIFPVGTTMVHIVDPDRLDSTFRSGHRELMVQVWYPAARDSGRLATYRRWRETTLLSSYDAVLQTHSHQDAPVALSEGPFPLLLFNPAWEGQRTQDTFLLEDLASHGFVIAAIDHTHNSMPVAFPDGLIVRSSEPRAVDDFGSLPMEQVLDFAQKEIATEVADDRLVLGAFGSNAKNPKSMWYRKVDNARSGALGHSFGGAVAVAACAQDARILAALNMDGWMFGAISAPLNKPLFDINDGDWPFSQQDVERERRSPQMSDRLDILDLDGMLRSLATSGGYLMAIDGTLHMNFTDRPLYSPLRALTGSGPRDPRQVHRLLREYTLAFFSKVLRKTPEPLLESRQLPTGVQVRAWPIDVGK